jgi:hypothetical protein
LLAIAAKFGYPTNKTYSSSVAITGYPIYILELGILKEATDIDY